MFKQLIKKLNNPNILCNVFLIATLLVIIERTFSIISLMFNASANVLWNGFEYTLALLLPLAYFAYFCSSKHAKNQMNKVKAFLFAGIMFILIGALMCAQISCNLLWHGFSTIFSKTIIYAQTEFPLKLNLTMFWGTIYIPVIFLCVAFNILIITLYGPDTKGVLKGMAPVATPVKAMPTGKYTCEMHVCNDAVTGTPIVILGTKLPSITSTWTRSAPDSVIAFISLSRFAKSLERIEGDIWIIHKSSPKIQMGISCLILSQNFKKVNKAYLVYTFFHIYFTRFAQLPKNPTDGGVK